MSKVLKAIEGWKLVIAFVLLVLVRIWDAAHNGSASSFVGPILAALGWAPPEWTVTAAGEAATLTFGLIAIVDKVLRAQKQLRAGAKVSELLSAQGYAKQAAAEAGAKS